MLTRGHVHTLGGHRPTATCCGAPFRVSHRTRTVVAVFAAGDSRPVVLITGASTGIGKTTALHLAKKNWQVFAGVRKESDGAALVAESASIEPVLLDVTSTQSVRAAVAEVKERLAPSGRNLSGLVNNAGKGVFMPLELIDMDVFDDVMQVNVSGVVRTTQAALPLLRKSRLGQQPGRIVNIGSYAGSISLPLFGAYSASKFALEALSDTMRYELGPKWGIQTILIKASGVKTPIWDKSIGSSVDLLDGVEAGAMAPYRGMCDEIMEIARKGEETGISAEEVAATIEEALTAPRPRSRYLIGNGAEVQMTARRLLPDWIWDKLLLKNLKRTAEPLR
ncbi:hypothetical protein HYH02_011307 [Chlamydomonas schloesseri]|uniref:Uncharacterized protein n=1 Tax=Chlamydomonas schloesseri TaxID=2026947 RepID=A0A835TB05_9CHLO|nr:hypothetical protein HYH02_011307 [Chlamydomonas schloesseri]|eukprot:KAG2437044.1 hypothetical protein HYH02_011307 [Chlamydomonas schloesseri]